MNNYSNSPKVDPSTLRRGAYPIVIKFLNW